MRYLLISLIFCFTLTKQTNGQIIDMHMHGYTDADYWHGGKARNGLDAAQSADELLMKTIEQMDKHNIKWAVLSGALEAVEKYTKADPRFIPAYQDYQNTLINILQFEELVKTEKIKVFGEVMAVYHGRTLNHPVYQPYLEICEQYGIPVAYHTGGTFPSANAEIWKKFRLSYGDPLLIEDVLVRYPKLKIYLMHAGSNFYENALRMLDQYPQLYVDLGVILWLHPMEKDYAVRFLKSAKEYKVLNKVMFGSDQMIWPDAIESSIDFLNSMEFLTKNEKQMILCKNAEEFLNIKD